ncbi:sensor histidine kinase [Actinophytocola sp.]|uniref:sensor histidine kinase n=1 Tax=Actinophytocola sp. TaxID=1872138 RepID=UPI002ED4C063
MGVEAQLRAEFDRWERKENTVNQNLPYALLGISLLITLLQIFWIIPVNVPGVVGLTIAAALWVLWFTTLHPEWQPGGWKMGVYYAGLWVFAALLVTLSPWYGFFAFNGYIQAFLVLRGHWRFVGVLAFTFVTAASWIGGPVNINAETWWVYLLLVFFNMLLSGVFTYFGDMTEQRNQKQKQALVELESANAKLEAALEENAGLHAQLLVQAREAGVMDERQRMAGEIHDTLAQGLAGILTQLQAAEQTDDEPEKWHRHVTNAMTLARESLTEARRTVHAVEPTVLAEARLPEAISEVTRRWAEVNHIDAVLTTTGDARPMHANVEVALLRTAQEALANVAKHAKASRVGLTLSYMEDLVTLDVRDDGVGFDPNVKRANGSTNGGFGLAGMRQRVQRLSGRLDIESEPGGGTAISATVPAIPAGGVD